MKKQIPKQLTKLLLNSDVSIHPKLPEDIMEIYGRVSIQPEGSITTHDIYVVYHSKTMNRLVWPSIPVEIEKEYETKGSSMRLIEYITWDIPNKADKLLMIVEIERKYDFKRLLHRSIAKVYIPKKKKTFKRISREYYKREENNMTGTWYDPYTGRVLA